MAIDFFSYLRLINNTPVKTDGAYYNQVCKTIDAPINGNNGQNSVAYLATELGKLIIKNPTFKSALEPEKVRMKTLLTILNNRFGITPPLGFHKIIPHMEDVEKTSTPANT
jgi:hypothetical protein